MEKLILKEYIKLNIQKINEENEINWKVKSIDDIKTYGDLRVLISNAQRKNTNKKGFKIAKTIAGVLPGVDTITSLGDIILGMWKLSGKGKKTNSFLDNFRIDKEIQKILDNKLEGEFLKFIYEDIGNKPNDEPIESFNMTEKLNEFLIKNFEGVHFTGHEKK